MKRRNIIIIFLSAITALSFIISGCNRTGDNKNKKLLGMAKSRLYDYYCSDNPKYLHDVLNIVDSINSPTPLAYYMKIQVLILQKNYSEGIKLVQSIDSSKFYKPYHKNMYIKEMKAMQYEERKDSVRIQKLYREVAAEIQTYLNRTNDIDALPELYTAKQKFETKEQVFKDIDNMYDNCYYNDLYAITSLKYLQETYYNPCNIYLDCYFP